MLIASKIGVSLEFDVLLSVFVIPNMIVTLLLYALPHIVIPRLNLNEDSDYIFYKDFVKRFFWPYAILVVIIIILYNICFLIYINYFASKEFIDYKSLVYKINFIFSFYILFSAFYNILKAVYNARNCFALPAFLPLLIHASVIAVIYVFYEDYGIYTFAYGLLIGSIFQIVLFAVDLKKKSLLKLFSFNVEYQRMFFSSYAVILLIEFLGQSYTLIDRSFISSLPMGHVSAMYYAGILNNLPITFLGLTLGTILFPKISLFVQEKKFTYLRNVIQKSLLFSFIIGLFFTFAFYIWGKEIIILVLERGVFTNEATRITYLYLFALSFGIPFVFVHIILAKLCFALHLEKMLLFSTVIAVILKLFLSKYFVSKGYYYGLTLSTSISFALNVIIIFTAIMLGRKTLFNMK
ncbi:lipid II flippase MurJ [Galbibacter orientalis]|nr:lipid II flippase MurJ [Galbibacter orientalis]